MGSFPALRSLQAVPCAGLPRAGPGVLGGPGCCWQEVPGKVLQVGGGMQRLGRTREVPEMTRSSQTELTVPGRDAGGGRGRSPRSQCRWEEAIVSGTWCVAEEKVRVRVGVWGSVRRGAALRAGEPSEGRRLGPVSGILVSGTQARPVPSRMGSPACPQPPGGSRRLPKGGEKALLSPSLVIRPFNCNYFCN